MDAAYTWTFKVCCIVDPQTHQAGMIIKIRVIHQFTSLNHPWSKHLVLKVLTLRMTAQRLLQEKSPNKKTSQDSTQLNDKISFNWHFPYSHTCSHINKNTFFGC